MPVTLSQMRKVKWTLAFEYDEERPRLHFQVFTQPLVPKLTMTHIKHPGGVGETAKMPRTEIVFRAYGRKAKSLTEAVRWANEEEAKRQGRGQAAGSVEALRRIKASVL